MKINEILLDYTLQVSHCFECLHSSCMKQSKVVTVFEFRGTVSGLSLDRKGTYVTDIVIVQDV